MRAGLQGLAALIFLALSAPLLAQTLPPPFLIIEQDRLLRDSRPGQEILRREQADRDALRAEGRALDAQFEAEELELTERRDQMDAAAFRELADAFDTKVVETRRVQEEKETAISRRADARRRQFLQQVQPILLQLLDESGAASIVDRRFVLIFKQDLNITTEVIKRLDAATDPAPGGETPGATEN